jgi:ParB family chromosome partitioning protein
MRLAFADPRQMTISPLNMNHGRPDPDVSDILPSVRQRGVLLTLLVLETIRDGAVVPDHFEIVAGARRWCAAMAAIAEGIELDPVPIAILEAGDDAAAIEASLIENLGRLPPDEVTCWETFTRLIRSGRTPEQIAATFGMSDMVVKRTLALGNLLPRIRNLYRRDDIDVATVRHLTLATKAQQKAWLALLDDPNERAPTGSQLKAWLFGGASIPTKNALFPLDGYPGQVVADLFGEDSYFADPDLFWTHQNEAIAARAEAWRADGWADVEVLQAGQSFESWRHERVGRREGGKVFIAVNARGEVTVHDGWLTTREARKVRAAVERKAKGGEAADGAGPAVTRPEVTSAQQTYIDLHRHAAVRAVLIDQPGVALRLLVAHAVAGGSYWRVEPEPQRPGAEAVGESLAASPAQAAFAERRRAVAVQLGFAADTPAVVGRRIDGGAAAIFARLLPMSDAEVLNVAAVVMGESLAAGGTEVEAAGAWMQVDVSPVWRPDTAFFDLIRDRETVNAMLREVGGKKVADGNVTEKVRTQKAILRDFLDGTNDRPKVERWTPRWMVFPAAAYTRRPFATASRARTVAPLLRRARALTDPAPAVIAAE